MNLASAYEDFTARFPLGCKRVTHDADDLAQRVVVRARGHDPDEGLGPRRPHHQPTRPVEHRPRLPDRSLNGRMGKRCISLRHGHVDPHLGVEGHRRHEGRKVRPDPHEGPQDEEGTEDPVPGRRVAAEDHVPRRLAPEVHPSLPHRPRHVPVAHRHPMDPEPPLNQVPLRPEVGEDGEHDRRGGELVPRQEMGGERRHELVALHHHPPTVHEQGPVAVAVEPYPDLRPPGGDLPGEGTHRRGPGLVDPLSIGLPADHGEVRPELGEERRRDLGRRPVGAVEDDLYAAEREVGDGGVEDSRVLLLRPGPLADRAEGPAPAGGVEEGFHLSSSSGESLSPSGP